MMSLMAGTMLFGAIASSQAATKNFPVTIERAIALTIANSAQLQHHEWERGIVTIEKGLNIRRFLPTVDANYSQHDGVTYNAPDSHTRSLNVTLNQPIYSRGALLMQQENYQIQLSHLSSQRDERERNLIFETMLTFIEALQREGEQAIYRQTLSVAQQELQIVEQEFQLGIVTRNDYLESRLVVEEISLQHRERQWRQELAERQLGYLLGLSQIPTANGAINREYRGLSTLQNEEYYYRSYQNANVTIRTQQNEIRTLQRQWQQTGQLWLPAITAQLQMNLTGDQQRFNQLGYSAGLDFDFAFPAMPVKLGFDVGWHPPDNRTIDITISSSPLSGLDSLTNRRVLALQLQRARSTNQQSRRETQYIIRQTLLQIEHQLQYLDDLRARQQLQQTRLEEQRLLTALGEVRHIDLLNAEIDAAQTQVELIDAIVSLFSQELTLLQIAGLSLTESSRQIIIDNGEQS